MYSNAKTAPMIQVSAPNAACQSVKGQQERNSHLKARMNKTPSIKDIGYMRIQLKIGFEIHCQNIFIVQKCKKSCI